jgi:Spy/CpxP family protein refolding chaperone
MNRKSLLLVAVSVAFLATVGVRTAAAQQPDAQQEGPQPAPVEDPIRQLNLTPQQREQIRTIRQQLQPERAAVNQRVRQANRALESALDADNPDEALIEQRINDLSAAQAAQMRLRAQSELRIRRVLTPEQRILLRHLLQAAQEIRRERQQRRQGDALDGGRRLRNQRNAFDPNPQRPNDQRTRPRP